MTIKIPESTTLWASQDGGNQLNYNFFDIMKSFLDQWSVRISGEEIIHFAKFSDVLYEAQVSL